MTVAAGILLGVVFTASPLTVVALALAVPLVAWAGRGLPDEERRLVTGLIIAALGLRALAIGGMAIAGIPHHNDLAIGSLTGDDAYYLSRAIRTRDVLLGYGAGKYDYFVMNDEYGRTSYLGFVTALQWLFGPTPFSLRLLNAVVFVTAAVLLFRMARQAFGALPSLTAFAAVLFLPSLLWSSISIAKEPVYFLCSSILVVCAVRVGRERRLASLVLLIATGAAMLWLLDDLRRGALVLSVSGLVLAVVIRFSAATPGRLVASVFVIVLAAAAALLQPRVQARAIDAVEGVARLHGGHVFTAGHAYKLLDEGFYKNPSTPASWPLDLTGAQAARFVVRAGISFLMTPWPWEMRSRSELAFLPELLLWYLMLVGIPAGIIAGWARDRWTVSVLIGFAIPIAAAVAVTNGNVGTLLRLRGLITPYVIWIGVLGLLVMANALARGRGAQPARFNQALEGHA
jgi:hypothetical protein